MIVLVLGLVAVLFLAATVISVLRNASLPRDDRLVSIVEWLERKYPVLRRFDATTLRFSDDNDRQNHQKRMSDAHIRSIQVGTPETYGTAGATDPMDRPWETAFYKDSVDGDLFLGETNLEGDAQADLRHHGGPEKAVCVYPSKHYPYWGDELGLDLGPAAFGENFTTTGFTEREACIGDIYNVREATVQITQPRSPCWKLARRWQMKDLAIQFEETGYTGWYLRALETGTVAPGQSMALASRPNPDWSVARATNVRYRMPDDRELARELAGIDALGESWTSKLDHRAETGEQPYSTARVIGPNANPDPQSNEETDL